jgi:hypothetical protein
MTLEERFDGVSWMASQASTGAVPIPESSTRKPIGRPKGFDGTRSRMPSALAQAFKSHGLDWKEDFAAAIKNNKRERIKLWLKLLPYMITTTKRAKVSHWKGRPSKAARIALEAMEQDI